MGMYPTLKAGYQKRVVTDLFGGYNHNLKIDEGEFYHMENLTSDHYPLLANRGKRSLLRQLQAPHALLGKSRLAYIDGTRLWYGEEDLTSYLEAAGFVLSEDAAMVPKQLVSMGAYMVIYPDRLYINTENYTDCGSMEARFTTAADSEVVFTLCQADGTAYEDAVVSATAPENPTEGQYWIDSSGSVHGLKQYSAQSGVWTEIPTVYTKITYPDLGKAFAKLDGVRISGCAATAEDGTVLQGQLEALNGSQLIYDRGDDYLVIVGILDRSYTQATGSVTVERLVPDMDFITEAGNRLWGCKYGLVEGKTVNELYCCAQGDFKNWERYQGISTDSYRATVGSDGPWTGAVTHLGYPIFFKENCLHKVYVSSTGAHQIVETACRGVQRGSHKSLAVVNETLYYKSAGEVCAYDGSLPHSVSPQLGSLRYGNAVGGSAGDKYYLSMEDQAGDWHLFVLDTAKGLWHREDGTRALGFARCGGELYFADITDGDAPALKCVRELADTSVEDSVFWLAETGLIGYATVQRKYVSRINLRMMLPVGSELDMYIQYDSLGDWQHAGHVVGMGTNSFLLPLRPRRCDHFRIRLTGTGDVRIFSFAKMLETGSDIT